MPRRSTSSFGTVTMKLFPLRRSLTVTIAFPFRQDSWSTRRVYTDYTKCTKAIVPPTEQHGDTCQPGLDRDQPTGTAKTGTHGGVMMMDAEVTTESAVRLPICRAGA